MEEKQIIEQIPQDENKIEIQKSLPKFSTALIPKDMKEAIQLSDILSKSGIVPKDLIGKPQSIFVAIAMGMEVGLPPIQAIQNIYVVNGRPAIWGDALKALVIGATNTRGDNVCEFIDEDPPEIALKQGYGRCRVKRMNKVEKEYRFSIDDAKRANLWGKAGPWTQYPGRMLMMRARSWVCRDEFPDILKGLQAREEVEDYQKYEPVTMPKEVSQIRVEEATIVPPIVEEPKEIKEEKTEVVEIKSENKKDILISQEERVSLFREVTKAKINPNDFKSYLNSEYGISQSSEIYVSQLPAIKEWIEKIK